MDKQSQTIRETREREVDFLEKFLRDVLQKRVEAEKVDIHEIVQKKAARIPYAEKIRISREIRENEKLVKAVEAAIKGESNGDSIKRLKERFKEIGNDLVLTAEKLYADQSFDIPNYPYLKHEQLSMIDRIIAREDGALLNNIGFMFFDVDALKTVNDRSEGGHSAGDLYLEKIASVLTNGKAVKWLRNQGLEVIVAHRSGDEFMVSIKDIESVDRDDFMGINDEMPAENMSILEYAMRIIQQEVQALETKDLFDFSKDKQRAMFQGLDIPADFKFQASMSGGAVSLREAVDTILQEVARGDISINNMSYEEILKKIQGKMLDMADNTMIENKGIDKKRRESGSEVEQLMEKVYRAGRSEDYLRKEVGRLEAIERELSQENQEATQRTEVLTLAIEKFRIQAERLSIANNALREKLASAKCVECGAKAA